VSHRGYFKWLKGISLALAIGALVVSVGVWLVFFPPNGKGINKVTSAQGQVALTFDDGPNPPHTEELLELLARHNVKATFFMVGRHVHSHPEVARKVFLQGHEITNHSFDGEVLAFKTKDEIAQAIMKTENELRAAIGEDYLSSRYFRAPKLIQFVTVASVLQARGLTHIGASAWAVDWTEDAQANPERLAEQLLSGVQEGDIIVMHDGEASRDGADRSGTVKAVALVLDGLRNKGLRPVTVSELLTSSR